ncbi:MAG: hypothetical protein EOP05_12335 [Proteobacteria bacterium]|nr:MAG: hypothetical protein EOP05_12335 [Pseudomonadota bacterium]
MKSHSTKIHYPLESLGLVHVERGQVRAERLEQRLEPAVPFPHRHDFYQVCWITAGQGWHEIDFKKHKLIPNRLFFMKPGQVHSWSLSPGTRGFVIEFSFESLSQAAQKSLGLSGLVPQLPDFLQIPKTKSEEFRILLQLMHKEFSEQKEHAQIILASLLHAFMVLILRESPVAYEPSHRTDRLEKFQELVEASFSKRLLSFSTMNVGEIGASLGFEDANYFTRFFTSQMKVSPNAYRKNRRDL